MLTAIVHDQFQTTAAYCLQVRAAHHAGNVFAGQCQFHADVATDGAGADDRDLHSSVPARRTVTIVVAVAMMSRAKSRGAPRRSPLQDLSLRQARQRAARGESCRWRAL